MTSAAVAGGVGELAVSVAESADARQTLAVGEVLVSRLRLGPVSTRRR